MPRNSSSSPIGVKGTVETAAHVIVTVPLGVLKAQTIHFEPAHPDPIGFAVNQLGFGVFEKVVLQLKQG
jgi:polyamine oxidase